MRNSVAYDVLNFISQQITIGSKAVITTAAKFRPLSYSSCIFKPDGIRAAREPSKDNLTISRRGRVVCQGNSGSAGSTAILASHFVAVFDRFWRAEPLRTSGACLGGGAGWGWRISAERRWIS